VIPRKCRYCDRWTFSRGKFWYIKIPVCKSDLSKFNEDTFNNLAFLAGRKR
jgi:hypothetical protein